MQRDLSIVIVHYRTPDLLRRLLQSLQEAGLLGQTVVVDNGSPDFDPQAFQEEFPAQFVCLPVNRGYSFAVNRGVDRTEGDSILLLNADVLITGGEIEHLLRIWQGLPHPGALGPLHRNSQGVPQQTFGKHATLWNEWRRKYLEKNLRRGNARAATRFEKTCRGTREVAWVSGSCLLIAREALQAAGPWDEDYFLYFEDMDWCLRAQKAGYRVYHTGEVSVLHEHGASMAPAPKETQIHYRQSQLRFFSKYWNPVWRDVLRLYLWLASSWRESAPDQLAPASREMRSATARPRVLHVVASLAGGAAEHIRLLAREQIRRGWDVCVCLDTEGKPVPVPESWSGIPMVGFDFLSKRIFHGMRQFRRFVQQGSWCAVHFHGHRAAAVGRIALLFLSSCPRLVVTYHGFHPPYYRTRRNRTCAVAVERLLRRVTDHFICVSPSTAHDAIRWVEIDPARITVIRNAIDPYPLEHCRSALRTSMRERLGIRPDSFVILYLGRFHRQKGVRYLLEAFALLNPGSSAVLLLAGDGPDRQALETEFGNVLGDSC
ncbi:MAG TPA: glycosyltransferase, partial [bacterium]|nr:glycosyltransferase [bacterium]